MQTILFDSNTDSYFAPWATLQTNPHKTMKVRFPFIFKLFVCTVKIGALDN